MATKSPIQRTIVPVVFGAVVVILVLYFSVTGSITDEPTNIRCYSCEENKELNKSCSVTERRIDNGSACIKYALTQSGVERLTLKTAVPVNFYRPPVLHRHFGYKSHCKWERYSPGFQTVQCFCTTDLCNSSPQLLSTAVYILLSLVFALKAFSH